MTDTTNAHGRGRHPFFWVAAALGLLALGGYVFAGLVIYRYGTQPRVYDFSVAACDDSPAAWCVSRVAQGTPTAAKLREGDRILALDDDARYARIHPRLKLRWLAPGDQYTITVERDGQEQQVGLEVPPQGRGFGGAGRYAAIIAVSLVWCVTGLLVGALKPEQSVTRLACVGWTFVALSWVASALHPIAAYFRGYELAVNSLLVALFNLVFPMAYSLQYRFPVGVGRGRFWSLLEYFLYACGSFLFVCAAVFGLVNLRGEAAATDFYDRHPFFVGPLLFLFDAFYLAGLAAMLAVLVRNYRKVETADQRRRARWVVFGNALGIAPGLLYFVLSTAAMGTGYSLFMSRNSGYFGALWLVGVLAPVSVPLAYCYAIVKHQVFNINVVVRRGIQYLLAKNALRALLALPVVGLVLLVLADPQRTVGEILFRNSIYFYLLLIAAVALGLVYRRRLGDWIDRKFFREAYDREKILRELIDDVKKIDSMAEMSRRVSEQVERALHPERVYLFYREEEGRDLSLGYSSGGVSRELKIPEEFQLLRFVESHGGAQDFPFARKARLPPNETDWLAGLGTRLVVPMAGTDGRLTGLFLLGEKKAEVPYTPRDRELLETLAGQIAIVYENARLKERVERERKIKQQVLARIEERNINLLKECPRCGACFDGAAQVCDEDASELTLSLPVERTIEGRYRLERLLGRGGMGAVYEAADLRLHRRVAVKILSGSLFGERAALRRFEREARTSARLSHPHIVAVYDYGALSTEGAYLVMELVRGETLGALLRREGALGPREAAALFGQVLDALQAAHASGVVHRDLKPENVFISRLADGRPYVRLLDFGLAKLARPEAVDSKSPTAAAPVTTPGAVLGTLGYMSPEQLTGGEVDERGDIFSIGVMVAEALTGRRPFEGKTYHELFASILHAEFRLEGAAQLPEVGRLEAALRKCLSKNAAARFASAGEAAAELIPALRACPPHALGGLSGRREPDTMIIQ